jgi:hypothetical protein
MDASPVQVLHKIWIFSVNASKFELAKISVDCAAGLMRFEILNEKPAESRKASLTKANPRRFFGYF